MTYETIYSLINLSVVPGWLLLVFLMWPTFALSPEPWSDLTAFISTGWAGWLGWFAGAWFTMSPLGRALREAPDV